MNVYSIYRRFQPWFRARRWRHFHSIFPITPESHVLDVGGHPGEWMANVAVPLNVTIVNLGPWPESLQAPSRFRYCEADARALPFADGEFALAYSNSVIEHMGTFEDQVRFADEIRRVGVNLYVQTPNKWFPVEPHFVCVAVHWLPLRIRRLVMPWLSFRGWFRSGDDVKIADLIQEIRLLDTREMKRLFPDCEIVREKIFGLTKSLIAVRRRSTAGGSPEITSR